MNTCFISPVLQRSQELLRGPHNPIQLGIALIITFFLSKLYLVFWYYSHQDLNILSSLAPPTWILLPAMDTAISIIILGLIFIFQFINSFLPAGKSTNKLITLACYICVTSFIIVSFKTQLIYGSPFTIDLYRSAGELSVMKDSILSYIGIEELIIITLAVVSYIFSGFMASKITDKLNVTKPKQLLLLMSILGFLLIVPPALAFLEFQKVYTFSLKKNVFVHFIRYYHPEPSAINLDEVKSTLLKNSDKKFAEELWQNSGFISSDDTFEINESPTQAGLFKDMNLLLILLESTGTAHLTAKSAPNLSRLKQNSLNFTQHYTTASTSIQSSYSIFYSDYLGKLDLRKAYAGMFTRSSIYETFKEDGYKTAVFQSGYLSYSDFGYLWENKGVDTLVGATELYEETHRSGWGWGAFEDTTVNEISKWLLENKDNKFILTYRPVFPHQPYYSPIEDKPFVETDFSAKFKNAVYYVDYNIGHLLKQLEKLDLRENTVIAVLADHGETISRFLAGHGLAMSEEELHVPFFIHHKSLFPHRKDVTIISNHLDVAPTLAEAFGLKRANDWKGRSLLQKQIKKRLMFISSNHSTEEGIIDNGLIYTINRNSHYEQVKDLYSGQPVETDKLPLYNKAAEEFQKWSIWQHLE